LVLVLVSHSQIFESPSEKTDLVERTEFNPNLLHHIPFFRGNITHIEWSPKSDGFLLSSDLCVSICYSLDYNVKIPLSSGNKAVIGSYYSKVLNLSFRLPNFLLIRMVLKSMSF
jgi:hypothetical protein